jgi:hypothetical protein
MLQCVSYILLAQVKDKFQTFVNTVTKFRFTKGAEFLYQPVELHFFKRYTTQCVPFSYYGYFRLILFFSEFFLSNIDALIVQLNYTIYIYIYIHKFNKFTLIYMANSNEENTTRKSKKLHVFIAHF